MRVLVDTNVIADVLHGDPVWASWSAERLSEHAGNLLVNPMIYAELSFNAKSTDEVDQIIANLGLEFEELPRPALYLAAQAFRQYRQRGGAKTSPLPDFFIGAHAQAAGLTLLTRDHNRYATYFPTVPLIAPDSSSASTPPPNV
jgi:predicted nucleic acid-binding protein